jgi:hypothetical protein
MLGDPLASLPILNFALLKYSRHVAAHIVAVGGEVWHTAVDLPFSHMQQQLRLQHTCCMTILWLGRSSSHTILLHAVTMLCAGLFEEVLRALF